MSSAPDPAPDSDHCDAGTIMADVLSKGRESCYKVTPNPISAPATLPAFFPLHCLTQALRSSTSKARDAFYACVEKHADKKPTEIATMGLLYPADCKKSRAQYVSSCRPSWVRHFDRQHCAKKRVQRLLDGDDEGRGPMSLPQPYTFKQ
ncbi:hypothetical protein D1007_44220 [Hordeum vulgare]|nr:hypothetical protein D1007_44220 [Hordeum vulgare]